MVETAIPIGDLPRFVLPDVASGPRLNFRDATVADAEFILSLRLDPAKGRFISATPPSLEAQREWLGRYEVSDDQLYFIIEHEGRPVGTARLYDQQGDAFTWGSWILTDDAPPQAAAESACLVFSIGIGLGFDAALIDVRKENRKVWRYYTMSWGAQKIGESEEQFYFRMDREALEAGLAKYQHLGPFVVRW